MYPTLPGQAAAPQGFPQAPAPGFVPPPAPTPQGYAQPTQGYAPQGYAQPPQGYAQPPQGYAQPPQGYAQPPGFTPPQGPAQPVALPGNIGAAIAGATMGISRRPRLPEGDFVLLVEQTFKPEISAALVAEFTVVESNTAAAPQGFQSGWYQPVGGATVNAQKAQNGACLGFVVRAAGFKEPADLQAHLASQNSSLEAFAAGCFVAPGPLKGRLVRCSVRPSGKFTRPKQDGTGGGQPIMNHTWSPYTA